jgi:hypothetical protein
VDRWPGLVASAGAAAGRPAPPGGDVDAPTRIDARPPGPCNDRSTDVVPAPGSHVAPGTPITWPTNPPSGGAHFPTWVRWGAAYDPPIERGYWVHNLEHGGVVLLHNCATGCPAVVAQLEAVQAALPADPLCTAPVRTRTLITADPLVPAGAQVAASAWGGTYTADCFDAPSLRAFIDAHYAHGPEDTCAEGAVP